MTTPVIVLYQFAMHGTTLPFSQLFALFVVCVGVILATVNSVEANTVGVMFGSAGILSTSLYQIWAKTEQKALNVTGPQLLYNQSSLSFVLLLIIAPFMEDVYGGPESLLAMKWVGSEHRSVGRRVAWIFERCIEYRIRYSIFDRGVGSGGGVVGGWGGRPQRAP